jgi:hypothetical protein
MIRRWKRFLCRNNELFARHTLDRFADHGFRAIGLRGIEKIYAEIEGLLDQGDGVVGGIRGIAQTETARPTAAETSNAHSKASAAKGCVFH